MELHTLGVDGGYTQHDVAGSRARLHRLDDRRRRGRAVRFASIARMHDDGEKMVLGHRIRAGGGSERRRAGARHPGGTSLHRPVHRDEAGPALRRRRSARRRSSIARRPRSGRHRRRHPRSRPHDCHRRPSSSPPAAYRAKVKTPFEFVVERASGDGLRRAAMRLPLVRAMRELGMPLYYCQPPTGYADRAEAWVNTGALLNRMNFAVALTRGDLPRRASQRGRPAVADHRPGARAYSHRDVLGRRHRRRDTPTVARGSRSGAGTRACCSAHRNSRRK